MTFWKDKIVEIRGKDNLSVAARDCGTSDVLMTEKAAGENFCDGIVLYLDCGRAYITMHLSKFVELDPKKGNCTVCRLEANEIETRIIAYRRRRKWGGGKRGKN